MTNNNSIRPPGLKQKKRLKTYSAVPPGADPGRRLIAACVNQALLDFFQPRQDLEAKDRDSAAEFLCSDDCRHFLNQLGIPWATINAVLGPAQDTGEVD